MIYSGPMHPSGISVPLSTRHFPLSGSELELKALTLCSLPVACSPSHPVARTKYVGQEWRVDSIPVLLTLLLQ